METFITILVLSLIFFIGKFIYDTYLTDNTKKGFEEFRKSNPIDAAKIEKPKTQEQFNDLVSSVSDELYNKPKNLSELFPDFVKGLTKMMKTIDTPSKLELESANGDTRVFMTIQQKPESGEFYFHATLMDKESEFFSSDKFPLGSRTSIVNSQPNWDKLIRQAIENIESKKLKGKFQNVVSDEQKSVLLRFDGYYCITNIDGSGSTLVLRFYPDGVVIFIRLMGDPYSIKSWFKRDSDKVLQGMYSLINGVLDFSVSHPQRGSSRFVGYVKDKTQVHLHVNGNQEVSFGFIKVDEN